MSWGLRRCVIPAAITTQARSLLSWPGTWCKLGKHDPTGNILHLAQEEKVNSAKNSLRVSVNIKPFSSVINLNITIIVFVFRFNLLFTWLLDPRNVGRSVVLCVAFYLEFLCPVHFKKLPRRCDIRESVIECSQSGHWPSGWWLLSIPGSQCVNLLMALL